MQLKVNEKTYDLQFGMKFINEMDKRYTIKGQGGIEFGMGVNMAFTYLNQMNPPVLLNIFCAALSTEKNKPSEDQVEQAITQYAIDNDGLEGLFKETDEALGNAPLLKATIKNFKKHAKVKA